MSVELKFLLLLCKMRRSWFMFIPKLGGLFMPISHKSMHDFCELVSKRLSRRECLAEGGFASTLGGPCMVASNCV